MNLIQDIEITRDDVNLSGKIFGPDLGDLKGKSTRTKPSLVTNEAIDNISELLNVNVEITLSIDALHVNKLEFMTTISHNL